MLQLAGFSAEGSRGLASCDQSVEPEQMCHSYQRQDGEGLFGDSHSEKETSCSQLTSRTPTSRSHMKARSPNSSLFVSAFLQLSRYSPVFSLVTERACKGEAVTPMLSWQLIVGYRVGFYFASALRATPPVLSGPVCGHQSRGV